MKKVSVEFKIGDGRWMQEAWLDPKEGENVPAEQVKSMLQRVANNAYSFQTANTGLGKQKSAKHSLVIDGMRFEVKFLERTD